MTDNVVEFLNKNGFSVVVKDRESTKLQAFRRNIYFPEFLYNLGLTGHKEERFLVKIEAQDKEIDYKSVIVNIMGCGFYFPSPVHR